MRPDSRHASTIATIVCFLLASVVLLGCLEDVAGLHRDEAAFGLFAETIQTGARPLRGYFNDYTAPLHSYAIAATFAAAGESVTTLRLSGALFNLLAGALLVALVGTVLPAAAGPTPWLLLGLPAFAIFSRIAGENFALNPLLFVLSLLCFARAERAHRTGPAAAGFALAAFFATLGVWNHIVFLPSALAVAAAYLIFSPRRFDRLALKLAAGVVGTACGAAPRIVDSLQRKVPIIPERADALEPSPISAAALNFLHTLGGGGLIVRAAGEIRQPALIWVYPVLFVAALAAIASPRLAGARRLWGGLLVAMVLAFTGSWLMTPAQLIGSRIWLLPLWLVPPFLAVSLVALSPRVRLIVASGVAALGLLSLALNYFRPILATGGIGHDTVDVGGRLDNSWDFVDLRPLAAGLAGTGSTPIVIDDFTPHTLQFHLPPEQRIRVETLVRVMAAGVTMPVGSFLILYRLDERPDPAVPQRWGATSLLWRKDLSTPHHDVFEIVPASSE